VGPLRQLDELRTAFFIQPLTQRPRDGDSPSGGSRFAKQEGIYRNETKRNEISRNLRNEIETQLCAFVHCQIYSDSDWGTLSLLSLSLFEHTALGLHRNKKGIIGGRVFLQIKKHMRWDQRGRLWLV